MAQIQFPTKSTQKSRNQYSRQKRIPMQILIYFTLLCVVGSTQKWGPNFQRAPNFNWAPNFFSGLHNGMGLRCNPDIFDQISDKFLNYNALYNAFFFIQSPQYRNDAISQIRDSFYNFSISLNDSLRQDYNLSVALNYTLTVFASPEAFALRANIFEARTRRNAYVDIYQSVASRFIEPIYNYYFAGQNLGLIVDSLLQVANNLESKIDEPILKSLLHPNGLVSEAVQVQRRILSCHRRFEQVSWIVPKEIRRRVVIASYVIPSQKSKNLSFVNISHRTYKTRSYSFVGSYNSCLLYTSPSPRDGLLSRMPSSA
eukprot:TRINITY_DN6257_c0_g1_i2.p1 TRINITY_DN6257_c0_g1~~TRINITY_DN6257_c0_g1_i2.p1  ORF type:complete len:314 (-),score=26.17 TRINITY_DN6257_c0_g1_i2:11-952(-)